MDWKFDIRGNLIPYGITAISLQEFKSQFVLTREDKTHREAIFQDYLRFINDFRKEITPNFRQWLNGSFISRRANPKDLDIVTIIDHKIYQAKEKLIDNNYRLKGAKEKA